LTTLEKGIKILTLFTEGTPVLSVPDIAKHLHLPMSTAYRYVSALKQAGLIEEAESTGGYCLGAKILDLARGVPRKNLQQIALPIMNRLVEKTGETVILCGLRDHDGVCLEKVEGHHILRVSHERGATFPLHAGSSGKVLLAYLDARERDEVLGRGELPKFSETTITDPLKLKSELERVRAQGYAESDGEVIRGTYGIGAPILSQAGKLLAALSVSAPTHRLEGKKREQMIHLVVTAARRITEELRAQDVQ
jgi:DNA-binding IclR family transcriptional regulator